MTKNLPSLTGEVFGYLTVGVETEKGPRRDRMYSCLCGKCGAIKIIAGYKMRRGDVVSCGCVHRDRCKDFANGRLSFNNAVKTKIGDKFGFLTVVARQPEKYRQRIVWQCKCDCGKLVGRTRERLVRSKYPNCRSSDHLVGPTYPPTPTPYPTEAGAIAAMYLHLTTRFPESREYQNNAVDSLLRHSWIVLHRRQTGNPIPNERSYMKKCLRFECCQFKPSRVKFKLKLELGVQMTKSTLLQQASNETMPEITARKIKFKRC